LKEALEKHLPAELERVLPWCQELKVNRYLPLSKSICKAGPYLLTGKALDIP
jgi:hypothetical protein